MTPKLNHKHNNELKERFLGGREIIINQQILKEFQYFMTNHKKRIIINKVLFSINLE